MTQPTPPTGLAASQDSAAPLASQAASPVSSVGKKPRNVLGLIAMITAIVGFVFACIPGAFIIGWVLLPIAFILGIVALFQKGKGKGQAVAAVIVSVVGTVVGIVVFLTVMVNAVDDAFSGGEVTVGDIDSSEESSAPAADDEGPEAGSRENPVPIGTEVSSDEWTVVVNSVKLDATAEVLAANEFNSAPADGSQYALINYTVTYTGENPNGEMAWDSVEYVTADGRTIDMLGGTGFATPSDSFDPFVTLYSGGSASGNIVLEIPKEGAADGVLAVQTTLAGDKKFVALQ